MNNEASFASIYARTVRENRAAERTRMDAEKLKHTHAVVFYGKQYCTGTHIECVRFADSVGRGASVVALAAKKDK